MGYKIKNFSEEEFLDLIKFIDKTEALEELNIGYDDIIPLILHENVIVAKNTKDKIIGFLVYSISDDYTYIDSVFVAKRYRNKGVASKMIEFLKSKHKNILLHCGEDLIDFYRRNGFSLLLYIPNFYELNNDGYLMKYEEVNNEN